MEASFLEVSRRVARSGPPVPTFASGHARRVNPGHWDAGKVIVSAEDSSACHQEIVIDCRPHRGDLDQP
jgi:hypothetical protein